MQEKRGLDHFGLEDNCGVEELEDFLHANEYLGSFLSTESSLPQPPHVDFRWEDLAEYEKDKSLLVGFFPLTEEGKVLAFNC
jgi:hypothetical protein